MTPREIKIASASAILTALLFGLGPRVISDAGAAANVQLHNVHFYQNTTDGGFAWAIEACAKATTGDAGTVVDEGCESVPIPTACKIGWEMIYARDTDAGAGSVGHVCYCQCDVGHVCYCQCDGQASPTCVWKRIVDETTNCF